MCHWSFNWAFYVCFIWLTTWNQTLKPIDHCWVFITIIIYFVGGQFLTFLTSWIINSHGWNWYEKWNLRVRKGAEHQGGWWQDVCCFLSDGGDVLKKRHPLYRHVTVSTQQTALLHCGFLHKCCCWDCCNCTVSATPLAAMTNSVSVWVQKF